MAFDKLEPEYLNKQVQRIQAAYEVIVSRPAVVSDGRVIPDDGRLPIGIGKRIDAAVMFLDICDFSSWRSETLQEQDLVLRILTLFFGEVIRIIEDCGGTVEKNTGDGLMAYFPDTADCKGTQKAISAALTIFYISSNLIDGILYRSGLGPIRFRICVDYGPITIAEVGAARGFRGIVAIGTTANIASKMLSFATADTLLLGEQAVKELPLSWQLQFTTLAVADAGWRYSSDNRPYVLYKYFGRWIGPVA